MAATLRVVQCWDDGGREDARLCELLRRHCARASFNLNPGLHPRTAASATSDHGGRLPLTDLVAVYAGFTIANHSMTHPWPSRIPLAVWRHEVFDARAMLQDAFQQPVLGFAYPFGDMTDDAVEVVRSAGHVYARTCEARTPCFPPADPMRMPADCHHQEPSFWDRYERAKATGTVFYFWGHSWEFSDEDRWAAFDRTLARIAADPDACFTDLPELFAPAPHDPSRCM